MSEPASSLVCAGCGAQAPRDAPPCPFRCPSARCDDNVDHVLRRVLDPSHVPIPRGRERNPFIRYRQLLHSYHTAIGGGLSDPDFAAVVQRLDRGVLRIDGQSLVVTPFTACDRLAARLGLGAGRLWVKDETGNVSGSHKVRHLFGVMVYLQVIDALRVRLKPDTTEDTAPLAIASCGNAALAAAVVARAAGRDLEVFVPTWADQSVVGRLRALKARVTTCPREPGVPGDPCYRRFHEAVGRGALPFCCQGPDNGLTIEGGSTLVWEILDALGDRAIDRLFVQVGGGALASACVGGLTDAARLGRLSHLPRLHAVQTAGGFPLVRAYDRLVTRVLGRLGDSSVIDPGRYAAIAERLLVERHRPIVREELRYAATHRSEFMWPWESPPRSVATGILDDETYDWLAVVEGMLMSGGYPVVVDDSALTAANALALDTTGVPVDETGTAGLAGLMRAIQTDARLRDETLAVIFTGTRRA